MKNLETQEIVSISLSLEDLKKISPLYNENTHIEIKSSFITRNGQYIVAHIFTYNDPWPDEPAHTKRDTFESILRINAQTDVVKLVFTGPQGNYPGITGTCRIPIQITTSPNGRYIAYHVKTDESHTEYDIYVCDLETDETRLVTSNVNSEPAYPRWDGWGGVTPDGYGEFSEHSLVEVSDSGLVLFNSRAANLSLIDKYGDIIDSFHPVNSYIKNTSTGEIIRVTDGQFDKYSIVSGLSSAMTPDGRYVLFSESSENLELIPGYVYDNFNTDYLLLKDIQTAEVSVVTNKASEIKGDEDKGESISDDGRYVLFTSNSPNLVENDTNNTIDRFRKDMLTGEILRISVDSEGNQLTNSAGIDGIAQMSRKGKVIAFTSRAKGLVPNSFDGKNVYFANMKNYPLPSKAAELEKLLPTYYDDITAPTLEINTPYKNRPITKKRMIYLYVKSADSESGLEKILISNDNKNWVLRPANTLINWRITRGTGIKKIFVKSIDRRGNTSFGKTTIPSDQSKPIVKLKAPDNNRKVKGKVTSRISAYDPVVKNITSGVRSIRILRRSFLLKETKKSFLRYEFDTTKLSNGYHIFRIRVRDKVGNIREIRRRYFVNN